MVQLPQLAGPVKLGLVTGRWAGNTETLLEDDVMSSEKCGLKTVVPDEVEGAG